MTAERRVVVTGIGLRTPIGNTLQDFCESLRSRRCGIRSMPDFAKIDRLRTQVAGIIEEELNASSIPRRFRRGMGRVGLLAALAAREAVDDSGLEEQLVASPECGISFGSTAGSSIAQEEFLHPIFHQRTLGGLPSSAYLKFMAHTCAANLALLLGAKGPLIASCTACASGSQGIGFGFEQIRAGRATAMVSGGAEEMHFIHAGIFDLMLATSTRYNDQPERTPRPFDKQRDGLVVGEGSGCLVLEEYEHARRRGAQIYAEVLGFATNCSGTHLTHSDVDAVEAVLRRALKSARLAPEEIDHVNAHATATASGDIAESVATNRIFGVRTPVSGLKGYFGHALGASGAIESIATLLMMRDGFIAPTRNLEDPDPECAPLDHVIGPPREAMVSVAMNNNFAFGGVNTSLIFART